MLTSRGQQPPPPPQELRPWYYLNWFLIPAFVLGWPIIPSILWLWPVWAVLIIRSPWHNGMMSGALAWSMLLIGAFGLVTLMGSNPGAGVFVLVPGLALTLVTQVLWSKHKRALPAASPTAPEDSTQDSPADSSGEDSLGPASDGRASEGGDPPRFRRTRVRRRSPRGRRSSPGRRPPPPS